MAAKSKSKSYLNNPALQFISSALVDEATQEEKPAPSQAHKEPSAPSPEPAAMSVVQPTPVQKPAFEVPMKPVYVEVRSKRFNALMQPTLYRNLSMLAAAENISVNELMHRILASYVQEHM